MKLTEIFYFLLFILFFNAMSAQSEDEDPRISNKIIFNEVDVTYDYNPYLKKKSKRDVDNKKIRLYSLLHETILEPDNDEDVLTNFVRRQDLPPKFKKFKENTNNIKSTLTIDLPTDNIDLMWKFKNGDHITATDIKYSIIYAICSGLIREELIPVEEVKIVGNSVVLGSPSIPSARYYLNYLKDVYVLPSSCFEDFISLAEKNGCSYITDKKNLSRYYYENDCRNGWAKGSEDIINNSGPFSLKEVKTSEIEFQKNPHYFYPPKVEGFVIKATPLLTNWASNMEDGMVNLGIGIPKKSFHGLAGYWTTELKSLSVNLMWINHNSRDHHMKNKEFRKAIYYAINKTQMLTDNLNHDARLISGPFSDFTDFGSSEIEDWTTGVEYETPNKHDDYDEAKDILRGIGYEIREVGGKKRLFDKNNEEVVLSLLYHKNGITEGEENALETAIANLSKIGIILKKDDQDFKNNFEAKKSKGEFDLCYDKITIETPLDLRRYYDSGSKGFKNYSRFKQEQIDRLFIKIKEGSEKQGNELAGDIWSILHKDVASIFLWRMNSWYYFNKEYISRSNNNYVNSYYFFLRPEKWTME